MGIGTKGVLGSWQGLRLRKLKELHHSGLSWETGAGCRIEPEAPAWQAEILPLNQWCYTRLEKSAYKYPRIYVIVSPTPFTVLLASNISAYTAATCQDFITSIFHLPYSIFHIPYSIAALSCRQLASYSRCEAVKKVQSESNSLHKLSSVTSK